nr:hypothetical protein [Tanacetum cinerariifolium]
MNPIVTQQDGLNNALITAEVPAVYMHQFWNTIKRIGKTNAYDFKLDKKKCRVNTKFKKSASPKLKTVPASPKEPTQKGKRVKRPAKKATTAPTTGVVIRDTPGNLGNSKDENDDFNDEDDDNGNDDDSGNDDDGGNNAQHSEQTDSDDDENPSFTLKDYEEEEETQEDEYVHTPVREKSDDEQKVDKEEHDEVTKELYEDLNVDREDKDADMTNVEQGGTDKTKCFSRVWVCA